MDQITENAKAPDRRESMKRNKKLLFRAINEDLITAMNKTLDIAQLKILQLMHSMIAS